ncbi:MAG: ABC transporter permease [Methanomassiliicoccales archaeon]|nr:ABC transporter permease [Methanomassiliicoccales archaeon]
MSGWRTLIKVFLAAVALMIPWAFLSTALSLVMDILIIVLLTFLDARNNRVTFTMALRYALRRPSTTALVVCGLMVGTAIVSASFTMSDTLDNLILGEVTEGLGEVDLVLGSRFSTSYIYFDDTELAPIVQQLEGSEWVEHASLVCLENVVLLDQRSGLSSLSNMAIGLDGDMVANFGHFYDGQGGMLADPPSAVGAYLPPGAALELDALEGDPILLVRGSNVLPLQVERIVSEEGLGGYQLSSGQFQISSSVFVDRGTLQAWTGETGRSNLIFVTLNEQGGENLAEAREEVQSILQGHPSLDLQIIQDKGEILEEGQEALSAFTSLFFVFGSFSIIAGMALVLNIFTMLGEERKSEMGITRAVGMPRSTLRRLFTYEGVIYGAVAAGIGTLLGVMLAYLMILSISGMFGFGDLSIEDSFTFTPTGLAYSYLLGFLLTLGTVYVATARISRLNIVRAIRSVPEPPVPIKDRRSFLLGWGMMAAGIVLAVLGVGLENLGVSYSGLSLGALSLGLLLRRYLGDRLAWTMAALITLAAWLGQVFGLKVFPYTAEIEMLVVAGLFMLVAMLLLVMFNSDLLIRFFTAVIRARSSYRAVVRTAISYPLKAKFRTGLSIFIFGLVIFTVTILSMISGIMNYNIPIMVEETSGGFDTIAFTLDPRISLEQDPWERINGTDGFLRKENVSNVVSLPTIGVRVNGTRMTEDGTDAYQFDTLGLGVDRRFFTEGYYPLAEWDTERFATEEEVWESILDNGSLAIIDGGLVANMNQFAPIPDTPGLMLGDSFQVMAYDGTLSNITVVAVMKQSALGGLFVNLDTAYEDFKAPGFNRMLIDYAPGLDVREQSVLLEKDFLDLGLSTISVKSLAEDITSAVDSIFTLFRAFLAIGLVIGIVGLGIITIRAIHERRLEIGMMRAIGFTKRMVIINFALESAFISLLGIIAGSLLGIVVGYQLWVESLEGQDFIFVIDWFPILIVALLAFLATMLSILPAARGASKVSPAEVLRFE